MAGRHCRILIYSGAKAAVRSLRFPSRQRWRCSDWGLWGLARCVAVRVEEQLSIFEYDGTSRTAPLGAVLLRALRFDWPFQAAQHCWCSRARARCRCASSSRKGMFSHFGRPAGSDLVQSSAKASGLRISSRLRRDSLRLSRSRSLSRVSKWLAALRLAISRNF